jgi:hypothetical protein
MYNSLAQKYQAFEKAKKMAIIKIQNKSEP